jgi:hypothetical protein
MIDLRTYRSLHKKWDQCVAGEIKDTSVHPFHPYTTPDECGIVKAVMEASGSSMMYDVTTYDTYPGWLHNITMQLCVANTLLLFTHYHPLFFFKGMDDVGGTVYNFFNNPGIR